jgi:hypothetical protein
MALMITKNNAGARWEVTVDGKPRTYDRNRELAIGQPKAKTCRPLPPEAPP